MKVIAEDEVWCDFFYAELTTGLRRGEFCGLLLRRLQCSVERGVDAANRAAGQTAAQFLIESLDILRRKPGQLLIAQTGPDVVLNVTAVVPQREVIAEDEIWCDFFYAELTTGLRRGEICGLKWEDFDEVNGTLKVCRTVYWEQWSSHSLKVIRLCSVRSAPW